MRFARSLPAVLALSLGGVTGCAAASSGGFSPLPLPTQTHSAPSPAHAAPALALKSALRAFVHASLANKAPRAFSLLSHRCKLTLGRQQVASIVASTSATYGVMAPTSITIKSLSGSHAVVSYTMPAQKLNGIRQHWVFENGWRDDAC